MGAMVSKLSEWLCADPDAVLAGELRVAGPGIAPNDPVASGPLGHVQGLVGRLDQGLTSFPIPRKDRNAQAEREVGDRFAVEQDRLAADGSPNPLGHRDRSTAVRAAQHQNEFVASVARHQVLRPDRRKQDLSREVLEYLVARRVA